MADGGDVMTATKRIPEPKALKAIRKQTVNSGSENYMSRVLFGTPSRGLVRIEWHLAVRSLAIPPNWAAMTMCSKLNEFVPVRYTVADAQNIIVRETLAGGYEWMFLLEDDVMPPPDLLIRLNEYMQQGTDAPPVVSGLYFQKSRPPEPVLYRGRGNGYFDGFKIGRKVWVDGVPTGCLLVHSNLLRAVWNESPEYLAMGEKTRKVFESPTHASISDGGAPKVSSGTSDLEFCRRVMEEGFFKKAGYPAYQRKKYPFLCDTRMFCAHIAPDGTTYP